MKGNQICTINPEKLTNKRQRIIKGNQMYNLEKLTNKRQRIMQGKQMDNREKLTKQGTQDTGQINVRE